VDVWEGGFAKFNGDYIVEIENCLQREYALKANFPYTCKNIFSTGVQKTYAEYDYSV
jgi:hypothetical protein